MNHIFSFHLPGISDIDSVIASAVNDDTNADAKLQAAIADVLAAYATDETIPAEVRPAVASAMTGVCVEHVGMLRTKQQHGDREHIEFREIAEGWQLGVFRLGCGPAGFAVIHEPEYGRPCVIVGMVFDPFRLHGIAIKGTEAIGERWPNVFWLPGFASRGFHSRLVEMGIARHRDGLLEFIPKGDR